MTRCLALLCAAVLVAGCGSSSGSGTASSDGAANGTATATATTPPVRSPDLGRLPRAPDPSGSPPSSQGTDRNAFLRAVFSDAEALWRTEFHDGGVTYHPARLTIFVVTPTPSGSGSSLRKKPTGGSSTSTRRPSLMPSFWLRLVSPIPGSLVGKPDADPQDGLRAVS